MLHFGADWCQPCRKVESFVFTHPRVARELNKDFVAVKIDIDLQPQIAKKYGIKTIPKDVVMTPSGYVMTTAASPITSDSYCQMLNRNVKMADQLGTKADAKLQQREQEVYNKIVESQKAAKDNKKILDSISDAASGANLDAAKAPTRLNVDRTVNPAREALIPKKPDDKTGTTQTLNFGGGSFVTNPGKSPTDKTANPAIGSQTVVKNTLAVPKKVRNVGQQGQRVAKQNSNLARQVAAAVNREMAQAEISDSPSALPPIGMEGFCPVTLMKQQKWVKGNEKWGCIHRGKLYLFSSRGALAMFQNEPDRYSPMLAGFDPVIYETRGELVDGKRRHGVFYGEEEQSPVIVMFKTPATRKQFEDDPKRYITVVRQAMTVANASRQIR